MTEDATSAEPQPPDTATPPRTPASVNRRAFLAGAGIGAGGVGAVVLTAAAGWPSTTPTTPTPTDDMSGMDHGATDAQATTMTADEMDAHHKEGIDLFLENIESPITEGKGVQDAEFTMDGDVKVFELTAAPITWEVAPGTTAEGFAYNGQIPGPTLRVTEGETIRINVHNELDESHAIHWHGMRLPAAMDGVPFLTQDPIKPGESYTYEFVAKPAGSHMYHSHNNSTIQVGKGLLGALIIDPADASEDPEVDQDHVMILNDALGGFTINGKGFPATDAYVATVGEKLRFRFMNEGMQIHPMHLHGFHFEVIRRDGYLLPQPFKCDTLTIAPGERWDVIVDADTPGNWAFHCHILSHAEGPSGMFGMVTALIVKEA